MTNQTNAEATAQAPDDAARDRPWLSLHPDRELATFRPRHASVLESFEECVAASPGAAALWYFGTLITYDELDLCSDALAARLSSLGVESGLRVAILFQNSPEFVIATLATWNLGAIPTPANPAYRRGELAKDLRRQPSKHHPVRTRGLRRSRSGNRGRRGVRCHDAARERLSAGEAIVSHQITIGGR